MSIRLLRYRWSLLVLLIATGCAGGKKPLPTLFFPEIPTPPRIQYLYRFLGMDDIKPPSQFQELVVGKAASFHFAHPYGAAFHDNKIFVTDGQFGIVVVIDLEKRSMHALATGEQGMLVRPTGIAVDGEGTIYVADAKRGQVLRYSADEKYLGAWGGGAESRPVGLCVKGDRLYVADIRGHRVHVWDIHTGEVVQEIGRASAGEVEGELAGGYLVAPISVAVDSQGNIYVCDSMEAHITKFDADGTFLQTVGNPGDAIGAFARPRGIAVDRHDRLYVVDAAFENVQIFNPEGKVLMFFGGAGSRPGLMWLPTTIAIAPELPDYFRSKVDKAFDAEFMILVVNQYGPGHVAVYAFGEHEKYPPIYTNPGAAEEVGGGE